MKRQILALLFVCILCLSLTSCKGANYEEAMNLYEDGEYRKAIELFEQLDDYEDSAEMVVECKQQYVKKLLKEEHYARAVPVMEELDAIGELNEKVNKLTWCKVAAYLEENDVFTVSFEDKEMDQAVRIQFSDDGTAIEFLVVEKSHSVADTMTVAIDYGAVLSMEYDDSWVEYYASEKMAYDVFDNSILHDAEYEETNYGIFDITEYKYGDVLACDEQQFSGTNMMGKKITEPMGIFKWGNHVARQITAIAFAVEKMEIGISIHDLGFICFEIPEE